MSPEAAVAPGAQSTSAILVAEDEPLLRALAVETLRDAGFDVIEAADGAEALELLKRHERVAALISDIKMPRLDGYQLSIAALKLRPDLKIMLMTGFARDPVPHELRKLLVAVIHKPFDFDELVESARRMIAPV